MRPLCIYHANCLDGFTAAWIVHRALLGEVDLYPGVYQNPPPLLEVSGRPVIFVDFSYKRDAMLSLRDRSKGILILDHHKSAIEDLKPVTHDMVQFSDTDNRVPSWELFLDYIGMDARLNNREIYAVFDVERSGAGLAWDFFNPNTPRPQLVNYVEDRDLWRFALPNTREINASLFSYEYDLDIWDAVMDLDPDQHYQMGSSIERKHHKDVRELVKVVTRDMRIDGYVVPVANMPYTYTSDAGHLLSKDRPFAACYWDTREGRVFSLRSCEGGMDVSAIAKKYGGGGHRNAAGFRVPFDRLKEFEIGITELTDEILTTTTDRSK